MYAVHPLNPYQPPPGLGFDFGVVSSFVSAASSGGSFLSNLFGGGKKETEAQKAARRAADAPAVIQTVFGPYSESYTESNWSKMTALITTCYSVGCARNQNFTKDFADVLRSLHVDVAIAQCQKIIDTQASSVVRKTGGYPTWYEIQDVAKKVLAEAVQFKNQSAVPVVTQASQPNIPGQTFVSTQTGQPAISQTSFLSSDNLPWLVAGGALIYAFTRR